MPVIASSNVARSVSLRSRLSSRDRRHDRPNVQAASKQRLRVPRAAAVFPVSAHDVRSAEPHRDRMLTRLPIETGQTHGDSGVVNRACYTPVARKAEDLNEILVLGAPAHCHPIPIGVVAASLMAVVTFNPFGRPDKVGSTASSQADHLGATGFHMAGKATQSGVATKPAISPASSR